MELSKNAIIGIAAVAVIAIVAVAALAMMGGGGSDDITYELNGGVNNENNPTGYKSDVVTLYDPSREGYDFSGWYLEPGFINKVTSLNKSMGKVTVYAKWAYKVYNVEYVLNCDTAVNINPKSVTWESGTLRGACSLDRCFDAWYSTPTFEPASKVGSFTDIKSDTTLYAKWKSLAGTKYVFSVESTDPSYSLADSSTAEMRIAIDDGKRVLSSSFANYDYIAGSGTVHYSGYDSAWSDDESDFDFIKMDTLTTIDGKKELFVFQNDGSTYWIDEYFHVYRVEENNLGFTLSSYSTYTVPKVVTITVYSSDGITVKGSGTYSVGDDVDLTATASSGKKFKGFCFDGNGIYSNPSMKFVACDSLTLFALEKNEYAVYAEGSYSDPKWTLTDDRTGNVVVTAHSNPAIVSLEESMSYTASFTAKSGGKDVNLKQDLITGLMRTSKYIWDFESYRYTITSEDYIPSYVYYKNCNTDGRHHINDVKDSEFLAYTSPEIVDMVKVMRKDTEHFSDLQMANFVLRFVQEGLTYTSDSSGKGMDGYWKYPFETLFNNIGDCEDKTILYASLMKAMGYDVALLLYNNHMAVGIGMPSGTPGKCYEVGGISYYYCETTVPGWTLGGMPEDYGSVDVVVII